MRRPSLIFDPWRRHRCNPPPGAIHPFGFSAMQQLLRQNRASLWQAGILTACRNESIILVRSVPRRGFSPSFHASVSSFCALMTLPVPTLSSSICGGRWAPPLGALTGRRPSCWMARQRMCHWSTFEHPMRTMLYKTDHDAAPVRATPSVPPTPSAISAMTPTWRCIVLRI